MGESDVRTVMSSIYSSSQTTFSKRHNNEFSKFSKYPHSKNQNLYKKNIFVMTQLYIGNLSDNYTGRDRLSATRNIIHISYYIFSVYI